MNIPLGFGRALLGTLLVCTGFGIGGYITGWTLHQRKSGNSLVNAAQSVTAHKKGALVDSCVQGKASQGQLLGVLSIPSLHLLAPVEEGVSNAVLSVAVGHFPSSVMPGGNGTSVMLAHDVSYFAQLDSLKAGSLVQFQSGCTLYGFQAYRTSVVKSGSDVPNTTFASIVLDTCWPTNALWFTPTRFLVFARETGITRLGTANNTTESARQVEGFSMQPRVPAPAELVAQGLTLKANEAPMGRMAIVGSPSGSWAQSPGPLAVEASGLEAYFGAMHALAERHLSWWSVLAPSVSPPLQLEGASIAQYSQYRSSLDVTVDAVGSTPVSVTFSTDVAVTGGVAPGQYAETVVERIKGSELTIESWTMGG
ncbi:MAG: class D sortase [Acidimicrobiales bacterium]